MVCGNPSPFTDAILQLWYKSAYTLPSSDYIKFRNETTSISINLVWLGVNQNAVFIQAYHFLVFGLVVLVILEILY